MPTRGFSERQKADISAKIEEMDRELDAAKAAVAAGDFARARRCLERVQDIKVNELNTCFPDVAMARRHQDIAWSVLYEIFSSVFQGLNEFMRWLSDQLRKPRDQRNLAEREAWIVRLRRTLNDLRHMRSLEWPDGSRGPDLLDEFIRRLETIVARIADLDHEDMLDLLTSELGWNELRGLLDRFLEGLGDPDFSLADAYRHLSLIDGVAANVSESLRLLAPDDDIGRGAAQANIEMIERNKHRLLDMVAAAPPAPAADDDGSGSDGDGPGVPEPEGGGDAEPEHGGMPGPEWEQEPAYAAHALEWARRAYLLDGRSPTLRAAAAVTGADEHLLLHRFRTDFELLAEALAPDGRPPGSAYAPREGEEPQPRRLDRTNAKLERVRASLADFYAEAANPRPGTPPPESPISGFTPDTEAAVRERHARASHPRPAARAQEVSRGRHS